VDDEKNIVDILKFNLKKEYDIAEAHDGVAALKAYAEHRPELILLDVMLPHMSGFDVCRKIREQDRHTPIIMLTARSDDADMVMGLDLGADDYISKPFQISVVKARVRANMRRVELAPPPLDASARAAFVIDPERYDVFLSGCAAELTPREFELIKLLAASPGRVFSREELMRDVWQYDYFGDARAVDVAVRRLREKIEADPKEPRIVCTKRGVGYYFGGAEQSV
jgi:two-component system response regulator VicR